MPTQATSLASLKKQLLVLKNRVSYLERALRPHRAEPSRTVIADRRDKAEGDARRNAIRDYYAHSKIDHYRANPWALANAQEMEDKLNSFLKKRGLAPEPSDIPQELRKEAKALTADRRRKDRAGIKRNPFVD